MSSNGCHPLDLKEDLETSKKHLSFCWHEKVASAIFRQPEYRMQTTYKWVWRGTNPLSSKHVRQLIGLFPQTAIDRSNLSTISFGPPRYHHLSSTPDKQIFTDSIDEAISQFAFAPSVCDSFEIQMSDIPIDGQLVTKQLSMVVSAQSFVREFARSIIEPTMDDSEYRLILPDEWETSAVCFLNNILYAIKKVGPISRYSSAFWEDDKTLISNHGVKIEIAENIAALLLGWVACDNPKRCLDPFRDREEVGKQIKVFLYAYQPTQSARRADN